MMFKKYIKKIYKNLTKMFRKEFRIMSLFIIELKKTFIIFTMTKIHFEKKLEAFKKK